MDGLKKNPKLISQLPTEGDVLSFYSELRAAGLTKNDAIRNLSIEIVQTWTKADCPCLDKKIVMTRIQDLIKKAAEGKRDPRESHQAKKPKTGVPSRRSGRLSAEGENQDTSNEERQSVSGSAAGPSQLPPDTKVPTAAKTRTRSRSGKAPQEERASSSLFDILSRQKVDTAELTFDEEFYTDQKGARKLWISKNVSSEFREESQKQQKLEANKERLKNLAMGQSTSSPHVQDAEHDDTDEESFDDDLEEADLCDFMDQSTLSSCPTPDVSERPLTRSSSTRSSHMIVTKVSEGTQTDSPSLDNVVFPQIPTKKASLIKGKASVLIEPKILEAIVECETTARCSLSTSIEVVQIVANRIFGQKWELPLSLDKNHLQDIKRIKQVKPAESLPEKEEEVEVEAEAFAVSINEEESFDVNEIEERISKRKQANQFRLPSMSSVRNARTLIAIETEKKIGEEMLMKECAIIPDGTGRKVIGKVGGAMLQVGGRLRVLPFQIMGNETRENWARFIDHILTRMSVVSEIEKKELWYSVLLFISDQCKTNKGLAKEVAKYMGLEHEPGQIYCNIHPVLMFDEKMKKVWQDLQIRIGADKIFPSFNYSNMDQETTVVILQGLDAIMRLVSPSYSHKAWSRYFQFNKFLGSKKNKAFAVKDRRFGALPASCLVGLHHFDDVQAFLDQHPDCRNQLACICRGMADLEDVLKFSWACLGLIGLHLYEPYLYLIIDLNTVQSKLIKIFPQLYEELNDKERRKSLCQLESPALESIAQAWRSPLNPQSPYDHDVIKSLQNYLSDADLPLMEAHMNEALKLLAAGFSDQKGSAYGFGPNKSAGPAIIQEASLQKLDKFHTHSKAIENAFGHMDNLLKQTGPQGFTKAVQSMQIASCKDLVFGQNHSWRHSSLKITMTMKSLQLKWTEGQQKLLENGVKDSDVHALQRAQMMTKLIASLKKHDGPLNSDKEIDAFLKKYKKSSEKEIARMLNEEIRFRRDSNLRFSVSKECYLYRQRGLSNEQRIKNLRLLVQRPDGRSSATMDDLRSVILEETPVATSQLPVDTTEMVI